ncbi:unnamed protein product [Caenorhabditis angaria]|uniref:Uncharacterized protein n=1 Tax=Caenorhabditis angaria TaxID=860376 RepID=A0A9P1J0S7_9PELO|nr:unnamed protein product [Caenorhabditis angaria]
MRQKEAEVNVRLKVRPLGSNWRQVRRIEEPEEAQQEIKDPNSPLDCNVWKTKHYRDEPITCGILKMCSCPNCYHVDGTQTSVELEPPVMIREVKRELKIQRAEHHPKPKIKVQKIVITPPPPVESATPVSEVQLEPAIFQEDVVLNPTPPAPPPSTADSQSSQLGMTVVAAVSSRTVVKVKSEKKTSETSIILPEVSECHTAIPLTVSSILENRDFEIENHTQAALIATNIDNNVFHDDPMSFRKIFYDSESNMWLLIAVIVMSILAYRSSMDTHVCYHD